MGKPKDSSGSDASDTASVPKVKKPKAPYNLGTQIRSALRTAWRYHPSLQLALKRERIEVPYTKKDGGTPKFPHVWYACASCGARFKQKDVQLDHVIPVGPTPGSKLAPPDMTWDRFIARLFCSPDNLKVVCKPCHKRKTASETKKRWEDYKNAG